MTQPNFNSQCTLKRQLKVALKVYTSRIEFWVLILITVAVLLLSPGLRRGPRIVPPSQPWEVPMGRIEPSTLHAGEFSQSITDARDIKVPESATFVDLRGTRVSDITMQVLLESPQIDTLHLWGTSITDNGLATLAQLPNLQALSIFGSNVSGRGFARFADKSKLFTVHLSQAKLNADGVRALAQQQSLRDLRIEVTPLYSKDLVPLRELKELRSISLDSTNVDDQAVDWLIELRQLKYINLAHTYISQEGARRLRRELPGIHIAGVSSIGTRRTQNQKKIDDLTEQRHRHGVDRIPIFMLPTFFVSLILGMHLKLQFAAPRSQMVPGFAKAHLIVAGGLIASASGSLALAAWSASSSSLFAILALELAFFAWSLWMAQLNTLLMLFGLILGAGWFVFGVDASTQAQMALLFLPSSANAASVVLLLAALAALTGLAVRLTRFREEMSEYGMVVSFDMIWDLASRSSNRQRQRIEANAISKSVFNAWIMDTQFDFAIRHLPKKWLPRAVLLLHVTHGFAILWMIPAFVGVFWLFGTVISGFCNASNGLTNVAPIFLTSIIPMMCLSAIMGQWLQHWRWYAGELLRPQSRQRYVTSLLCTMGLDGLIAVSVPLILVLFLPIRGFTTATLTSAETFLLCSTHITAHLAISMALMAWLTSYRSIWLATLAIGFSTGLNAGLTDLSSTLGADWLPVTLPSVLLGSLIIAGCILRVARNRWNTLEFA